MKGNEMEPKFLAALYNANDDLIGNVSFQTKEDAIRYAKDHQYNANIFELKPVASVAYECVVKEPK